MEYIRVGEANFKDNLNQRIFVCFMMRDKAVRDQKNGGKFITFNMVDKSTVIDTKIFGATERQLAELQDGKVYNAAVDIKPYDKSPTGYSCIIYNIEESNIPATAFADWAEDLNGSARIITDALTEIYESLYGKLVYSIVSDYWDKFRSWTAAKGQHHTQLGGLLTHTAEVVSLCDKIADYFDDKYGATFINRPLLLSGAILHDICKCDELDVDINSGKSEYSTDSVLETHIMGIICRVEREAYILGYGRQMDDLDSPDDTDDLELAYGSDVTDNDIKTQDRIDDEKEAVLLLKHILAAHHGKLEWGSPIVPSIPEAYILNKADELSAEMFRFNRDFKSLGLGEGKSLWSGSSKRVVYRDSSKDALD